MNIKLLDNQALKKQFNNSLVFQHGLLMLFWIVYCSLLLTCLLLFISEKSMLFNEIERYPNKTDYPALSGLIDKYAFFIQLSLMSFMFFDKNQVNQITEADFKNKMQQIDIAYSYLFITTLLAFLGLAMYILFIQKSIQSQRLSRQLELSGRFGLSYQSFKVEIYLTILTNLTIIFSFFNPLVTLLSALYGLFLLIVSVFNRKTIGLNDSLFLPKKWWKSDNFKFFLATLLSLNLYSLIKGIFMSKFGVNIDLLLQIIFPLGPITIIIALYIKNIFTSKMTSVLSAIRNISIRVDNLRAFFYSQHNDSFNDYQFLKDIPLLLNKAFVNNSINNEEAGKLMNEIDELIIFLETNVVDENSRKYFIYQLLSELNHQEELLLFKNDVQKIYVK